MKIKKIHYFNMIEVLLALTVIAIGMTSVLGLFPVGLKASRQAVAENSSANVADQMVTYMRVMGESSDSAYTATFVTTATNLPNYDSGTDELNITYSDDNATINLKSGTFDIQAQSDAFLEDYKKGDLNPPGTSTTHDFTRVANGWAIFRPAGASDLRHRVYFITQGPNCTEDGGNRNIDYSAMALVWKDTVQIKRLKAGGDPAISTDWELWPAPASYVHSGKINVELSWPLELPYNQRKKRYYQVVINKP